MARKPGVWYRKRDKHFYTTIRGEQIKLSMDRAEAERIFHGLMADQPEEIPTGARNLTFAQVARAFLEDSKRENALDTYRGHKQFLAGFMRHSGRVKIAALTPYMLNRWIAVHEGWGDSTRRVAMNIVQACLNWGARMKFYKEHPLEKLKKPPAKSRDTFVNPEQQQRILHHLRRHDPFRDFVFALVHSGCRPSEVRRVTCADFDAENGMWKFAKHKTLRMTGKPRLVYLTPELLDLCKKLSAEVGAGHLFRNRDNRPWTRSGISYRLRKLAEELDMPGLSSYLFRHGFITNALESGMSDVLVAELCGNSPQTVRRHYNHLSAHVKAMRDAAIRAVRPAGAPVLSILPGSDQAALG